VKKKISSPVRSDLLWNPSRLLMNAYRRILPW